MFPCGSHLGQDLYLLNKIFKKVHCYQVWFEFAMQFKRRRTLSVFSHRILAIILDEVPTLKHYFQKGPPKDYCYQVKFQLAKWFQRRLSLSHHMTKLRLRGYKKQRLQGACNRSPVISCQYKADIEICMNSQKVQCLTMSQPSS